MGKSILITGASTGIGRACVEQFAKEGHLVFACARKQPDLVALGEISQNIHPLKLDVTSSEDFLNAKSVLQDVTGGRLDGLVNNAGIAVAGPLEAVSISRWKDQFQTNLFSVVEATQTFLPALREAKGRIINMGSISGFIATPFMSPYSSSKHALRGLSESLRRETRSLGVSVSLIEPGPTKTPIWKKSIEKVEEILNELSPDMQKVYNFELQKVEKAFGNVERDAVVVDEVVKVVSDALFSAQPRAQYMVGKNKRMWTLLRHLPPTWADRLILSARK